MIKRYAGKGQNQQWRYAGPNVPGPLGRAPAEKTQQRAEQSAKYRPLQYSNLFVPLPGSLRLGTH